MTEAQIKEQIETVRQVTREALADPELARKFLEDPLIFPPQKKSAKKKKVNNYLSTIHVNDLRYSILDKLMSVSDINVLEKVNELISNAPDNNPVFKVTHAQKQMLLQSEDDLLNGDVISDDELNAEEEEWLNK